VKIIVSLYEKERNFLFLPVIPDAAFIKTTIRRDICRMALQHLIFSPFVSTKPTDVPKTCDARLEAISPQLLIFCERSHRLHETYSSTLT
jgi:hypothetical protein